MVELSLRGCAIVIVIGGILGLLTFVSGILKMTGVF